MSIQLRGLDFLDLSCQHNHRAPVLRTFVQLVALFSTPDRYGFSYPHRELLIDIYKLQQLGYAAAFA
jgi:hypothetical protein